MSPLQQPSDAEIEALPMLAVAARSGGAAAEELVRLTRPTVARFCRSLLDAAAAADAVQDTYLRVLRSLGRYDPERPLLPWLLTIARRVCVDHARASRRRGDAVRRLQPVAATTEPGAAADLTALVRALPEARRTAFVLTQILGFEYAEAARICKVPVGTIRSRVHRARVELIAQMAEG